LPCQCNLHEEKDFNLAKELMAGFIAKEACVLPEKQQQAYTDFYDSARKNNILDPKTTLLIHLASAMALGCYP
jgi:hypothetical protein